MINRNLIFLFAGQIFAGLGSGIFDIVLIWLALTETDNIAGAGIVIFWRYIPYAFFGLIGGWIGDQFDRRTTIVLADLVRAIIIIFAILAISLHADIVVVLSISGFLLTVARTVFQPAIQAIIPTLCPSSILARINSVHHGIRELLGIVAPVVGGVLLTWLAVEFVLGFMAILFLLGAGITSIIPKASECSVETQGILGDYRELIIFLKSEKPRIATALILNVLAIFGVAGVLTLALPALVEGLFPNEPGMLGILMGCMAGGTLLGATVIGWLNGREGLAIMYWGWLAYGSLIAVFVFPSAFWVIVGLSFLLGAVGAVPDILFATAVQHEVPENRLSRTFAVFSTLANLGEAISAPIIGLVVISYGMDVSFLIAGLVAMLSAFVGLATIKQRKEE